MLQPNNMSIKRKDAEYNILLADSQGHGTIPADFTGFDIARAALRHVIHFDSNCIALITFASGQLPIAGTTLTAGWAMGESLSYINRRS